MYVIAITDPARKRDVAREILSDQPEWFGIPEATEEYIRKCADMPFFAAMEGQMAAGFTMMKQTVPHSCEICVCGVKKRFHREGAGSALFDAFQAYMREAGYCYAQVKTVAGGYYPEYDETCMFYEHLGFNALEVFPTMCDEANSCLIMVKAL